MVLWENDRKSLCGKGLRQILGAALALSAYVARVYNPYALGCTYEYFCVHAIVMDGYEPAATATIFWADAVNQSE